MGTEIIEGRRTTPGDVSVTVFLIGMRINTLHRVDLWWPAFRAMPRMLRELSEDPESGMLASRLAQSGPRSPLVVQYWSSPEKLLAYASAPDRRHRPAWAEFNRRTRAAGGHVGIWHETFSVAPGAHESIQVDMPARGLAEAIGTTPVERRGARAAQRLRHISLPAEDPTGRREGPGMHTA